MENSLLISLQLDHRMLYPPTLKNILPLVDINSSCTHSCNMCKLNWVHMFTYHFFFFIMYLCSYLNHVYISLLFAVVTVLIFLFKSISEDVLPLHYLTMSPPPVYVAYLNVLLCSQNWFRFCRMICRVTVAVTGSPDRIAGDLSKAI